jgi:hypothetical protein
MKLFEPDDKQFAMTKKPAISKIYSYLVNPAKGNAGAPADTGAEIPLKGLMYDMLKDIFDGSEQECNIPISFVMDSGGEQKNPVRDELITFLKKPSEPHGRAFAKRLQDVTTGKSGLGLLFFTLGLTHEDEKKVVISRFPADQGVLAERTGTSLEVSFVEKVFMKNAHAYKSAVYLGGSYDQDFWDGAAIDRQINVGNLADYWIRDFLRSDFKITAKTGTKQLALALREATAALTNEKDKAQLVSAAQLVANLSGQAISVDDFAKRFGLTKPVREALIKHLPNEQIAKATFKFDAEEFSKHVKYTSKELDSGAILTAPSEKFDKCWTTKKVADSDGAFEFSARGKIVSERLKGRKI